MGFLQSSKPLKLIHPFSSSIKDQQKPIGQEKLMLACCQAQVATYLSNSNITSQASNISGDRDNQNGKKLVKSQQAF